MRLLFWRPDPVEEAWKNHEAFVRRLLDTPPEKPVTLTHLAFLYEEKLRTAKVLAAHKATNMIGRSSLDVVTIEVLNARAQREADNAAADYDKAFKEVVASR